MTQRTELQHRLAEYKAIAMNWVANRLFSSRQTGIDGFLKKRLLPANASERARPRDQG